MGNLAYLNFNILYLSPKGEMFHNTVLVHSIWLTVNVQVIHYSITFIKYLACPLYVEKTTKCSKENHSAKRLHLGIFFGGERPTSKNGVPCKAIAYTWWIACAGCVIILYLYTIC